MKNRFVVGLLFTLLLAMLIACGGGGGPGTTGTTSTTGIIGPIDQLSIRLEAVVNGSSNPIDPSNVFTSETIQFRITGIDDGAAGLPRVVLPSSGWTMTGNPGGLFDSSGLFVANSSPSGFTGTIKGTYNSIQYSTIVRVVTPQAVIQGRGRTTTGFPARGVGIVALDAGANIVATGFVAPDGTIRMSVPTTAVRFTVDFSAVDGTQPFYYARQFAYATKDFSPTVSGCTAPLPALTFGASSNLTTDVVFYPNSSSFPPPPPDGCS